MKRHSLAEDSPTNNCLNGSRLCPQIRSCFNSTPSGRAGKHLDYEELHWSAQRGLFRSHIRVAGTQPHRRHRAFGGKVVSHFGNKDGPPILVAKAGRDLSGVAPGHHRESQRVHRNYHELPPVLEWSNPRAGGFAVNPLDPAPAFDHAKQRAVRYADWPIYGIRGRDRRLIIRRASICPTRRGPVCRAGKRCPLREAFFVHLDPPVVMKDRVIPLKYVALNS